MRLTLLIPEVTIKDLDDIAQDIIQYLRIYEELMIEDYWIEDD